MQQELESFSEEIAKSILEFNSKQNTYKFYLTALIMIVFSFLYVFTIIYTNPNKEETIAKTNNNVLIIDKSNEKVIKVREDKKYKYVYKTYHKGDKLIYVTIGYRK